MICSLEKYGGLQPFNLHLDISPVQQESQGRINNLQNSRGKKKEMNPIFIINGAKVHQKQLGFAAIQAKNIGFVQNNDKDNIF